MRSFKVSVSNEAEFNEVIRLSKIMGYDTGLEFKYIPNVKTLFLNGSRRDIQWSQKDISHYRKDRPFKKIKFNRLVKLSNRVSNNGLS